MNSVFHTMEQKMKNISKRLNLEIRNGIERLPLRWELKNTQSPMIRQCRLLT